MNTKPNIRAEVKKIFTYFRDGIKNDFNNNFIVKLTRKEPVDDYRQTIYVGAGD